MNRIFLHVLAVLLAPVVTMLLLVGIFSMGTALTGYSSPPDVVFAVCTVSASLFTILTAVVSATHYLET
jgi:Na+/H+-dicarboxylate symporter